MGVDRIRAVQDVDAEWLTGVLHHAGLGLGHVVESFTATSIGTGQVGENVRFELSWSAGAGGDDTAPASVVGKFPSSSPVSRSTAVQVETYVREIGFYRDVQSTVDIRTPIIHHLGWEPATHDFVLVMEDLRGCEQGDQLAGCTVAAARTVVREAVGLHAPTWGDVDRLAALDWVKRPDAERASTLGALFAMTLPGFLDRYAAQLGSDVADVARRVVAGYPKVATHIAQWATTAGSWCLVHGDYRLDNLLFGRSPSHPAVTVVDWQTATIGVGPTDIAYFLGAGLLPDVRESAERELVADYASGLRERGVTLDDEAAWDGYVFGSAGGLLMAVLASQIVERTERGDAMFMTMAARHAAQIEHVGLLDRL